MVISSVLIGLVLLLDLFFICKEYSGEEKVTKIETEEKNVWDIKITNDQELKESNNETFYTMKIDFDEPIRKKKAKQLKKSKRLDILRKEEEDNGQFAYEETIQWFNQIFKYIDHLSLKVRSYISWSFFTSLLSSDVANRLSCNP